MTTASKWKMFSQQPVPFLLSLSWSPLFIAHPQLVTFVLFSVVLVSIFLVCRQLSLFITAVECVRVLSTCDCFPPILFCKCLLAWEWAGPCKQTSPSRSLHSEHTFFLISGLENILILILNLHTLLLPFKLVSCIHHMTTHVGLHQSIYHEG